MQNSLFFLVNLCSFFRSIVILMMEKINTPTIQQYGMKSKIRTPASNVSSRVRAHTYDAAIDSTVQMTNVQLMHCKLFVANVAFDLSSSVLLRIRGISIATFKYW